MCCYFRMSIIGGLQYACVPRWHDLKSMYSVWYEYTHINTYVKHALRLNQMAWNLLKQHSGRRTKWPEFLPGLSDEYSSQPSHEVEERERERVWVREEGIKIWNQERLDVSGGDRRNSLVLGCLRSTLAFSSICFPHVYEAYSYSYFTRTSMLGLSISQHHVLRLIYGIFFPNAVMVY